MSGPELERKNLKMCVDHCESLKCCIAEVAVVSGVLS